MFYDTYSDLEGSVAEGVQQPFEISIVTGIDEAGSIDLCYLAYPNPTNGFLMLKIENYSIEYLRYQLFDNSGKLIKSEEVTANPYTVTMEQLVTGTYFLKIIDKDKEIKIFKIIKN